MEKPRFKKSQKKARGKDQAFLMYFPYAEALLPFQPAGLKRRGPTSIFGPKGISTKHSHFISKVSFCSDSDSDDEQSFLPSPANQSTSLHPTLYDEDVMLRVDVSQVSNEPPSMSESRTSSYQSSASPRRLPADERMTTCSQFLGRLPMRISKALKINQMPGEDFPEDAWDSKVRYSVTPNRVFSVPKTESSELASHLKLPNVKREPLVSMPDSNTHSTPALVVPIPPTYPHPDAHLYESESMRATTKSPRPKTSSQAPERRVVTASITPVEVRVRPGPPGVAEKVDSQYREAMLDVLLRNKTSQDHSSMMAEYLKRSGLPEGSKVFILNSQDEYVRRALKRRNWVENTLFSSQAFHLKWTYSDSETDYRSLKPGQMFNHFANNRRLTTKYGLNSSFRSVSMYKLNPDSFYPRTYDLGDAAQLEEFKSDYERTAVCNIVKQHAEFFLSRRGTTINKLCVKNAIRYCRQLMDDYRNMCEHGSKYVFVPDTRKGFTCSREDLKFLIEYSRLRLPLLDLPDDSKLKCTRRSDLLKAWTAPSPKLISKCIALEVDLVETWEQVRMEGNRNVWIVKPGQNARGSGVHCSDDLQEIIDCGAKLQARIVQKYIERPLLLSLPKGQMKFDIRQWVLVTSLDPLRIHVFSSCYLRLCTQPFTLQDLKDKFSHLANYSVQKTISKNAEETVWSLPQFLQYLKGQRPELEWDRDIKPKIDSLIVQTLKSVSDDMDARQSSFELYGFDIILDEWLQPWLLEVNLSPACAERTPWLTDMLDTMADGLLALVLDGQKAPSAQYQWVNAYTGECCAWDCREQPPCSLEVVGEKANIRRERNLDRRFVCEQAAILIQRVARGFVVRSKNRHRRREKAAVRIQTLVRMALAKKKLKEKRIDAAVLRIQTVFRREVAVEACVTIRKVNVAVEVQALFRRWKAKELAESLRKTRNAGNIQRVWRRQLAKWRQNAAWLYIQRIKLIQKHWKARLQYLNSRAVTIQCRWRGISGRRKAVRQREFLAFQLKLQSFVRMLFSKRRLYDCRQTHIADAIQRVFRQSESKRRLGEKRRLRAIVYIQRWYKSYKSRKIFLRLRRAKAARIRAAVRIQATIKGHFCRLDFAERRNEAIVITIQTIFRSFRCREYCKLLRKRNIAAVVIQRRFRKFAARRKSQVLKRTRAQEKERQRRKKALKREKQVRAIAASDRLSQRSSEVSAPRVSPSLLETSISRKTSTVGNTHKEMARRMSARPSDGRRTVKEGASVVSPQPTRYLLPFDGMELLPRPIRVRVKTALQEGRRPAR